MLPDKHVEQIKRWGAPAPQHIEHGFPEDIRQKLEAAQTTKWWLEGNVLFAETQHGRIGQQIPSNYICAGMDKKGLPILRKIANT